MKQIEEIIDKSINLHILCKNKYQFSINPQNKQHNKPILK